MSNDNLSSHDIGTEIRQIEQEDSERKSAKHHVKKNKPRSNHRVNQSTPVRHRPSQQHHNVQEHRSVPNRVAKKAKVQGISHNNVAKEQNSSHVHARIHTHTKNVQHKEPNNVIPSKRPNRSQQAKANLKKSRRKLQRIRSEKTYDHRQQKIYDKILFHLAHPLTPDLTEDLRSLVEHTTYYRHKKDFKNENSAVSKEDRMVYYYGSSGRTPQTKVSIPRSVLDYIRKRLSFLSDSPLSDINQLSNAKVVELGLMQLAPLDVKNMYADALCNITPRATRPPKQAYRKIQRKLNKYFMDHQTGSQARDSIVKNTSIAADNLQMFIHRMDSWSLHMREWTTGNNLLRIIMLAKVFNMSISQLIHSKQLRVIWRNPKVRTAAHKMYVNAMEIGKSGHKQAGTRITNAVRRNKK